MRRYSFVARHSDLLRCPKQAKLGTDTYSNTERMKGAALSRDGEQEMGPRRRPGWIEKKEA